MRSPTTGPGAYRMRLFEREPRLSRWQRARVSLSLAWKQFNQGWATFRQNGLARLGIGLLLVFALMAVAHPLLMGTLWPKGVYDPVLGYDLEATPWPSPPEFPQHWLGTDAVGRDVLSMLMAAARPSFTLAIAAALTTAVISTLFGALSAYFRGLLDSMVMNLAYTLLLLPVPIVMVIIGTAFYEEIGSLEFGLLYGILAGASSATIVMRSHALSLMNRPFIEASRVAGAGPFRIITRHLVPHMLPLASVHMMLTVTGAVVANGFIAAFQGSRPDLRLNWGTMVYNAFFYTAINPRFPWSMLVAPSAALSLFAAAFYLVARGLQDVADPRHRGDRRRVR